MPGLLRFRYSLSVFHISVVFLVLCFSCFLVTDKKSGCLCCILLLADDKDREKDNREFDEWLCLSICWQATAGIIQNVLFVQWDIWTVNCPT